MINFESVVYKNISNITNEAISFEIKKSKINLITSINYNLIDNIYNSLIGLNNIKEGEIFINDINLYKNNINDIFSVIKNNVFFIEKKFFNYKKSVYENILNISYLTNIYDKSIFNKVINDLKIHEFYEKKLFEINVNEYILIILFFIKLSGYNIILIKDFFQFLSSDEDKKAFISKINVEIKLKNQTLILLSNNLKLDNKYVSCIDLNKNSEYTKYSEYIKISNNENLYFKYNKNYLSNFFRFYFKKNWISWIILLLFNFLMFSSIMFIFSFRDNKINIPIWYFVLVSLILIQISINIYMIYHFYKRNILFLKHSFMYFSKFFLSIICISFTMFGSQTLGVILSIIPILLTSNFQNNFIPNSIFISLLLINVFLVIVFSEILIFISIRNLFSKDEIKL